MAGHIGGTSNNGFDQFAELREEEQRGPAAPTSTPTQAGTSTEATARSIQQQVEARYAASSSLIQDEDPPALEDEDTHADHPPDYDAPGVITSVLQTLTPQEQFLQAARVRREETARLADPPPSIDALGLTDNPASDPANRAALQPRQSTSLLRREGNLFTSDPQGDVNHKLREALKTGRPNAITTHLNATNPAPNPATPSSVSKQNAFHKAALSSDKLSAEMINELFRKTPVELRAAAARAQDEPDRNTPLHLVQQKIGKLQTRLYSNRSVNQSKIAHLQHMATKLRDAAAAGTGLDQQPLDQILNKAGRTPEEEREHTKATTRPPLISFHP